MMSPTPLSTIRIGGDWPSEILIVATAPAMGMLAMRIAELATTNDVRVGFIVFGGFEFLELPQADHRQVECIH
jgi:hypothetical protein